MISSIPCAMANLLVPDWPAPARVRSLQTLRGAGCSPAPWDSFNLGDHVVDDPTNVAANRAALRDHLPAEPEWLKQVHGIATVNPKNRAKTEPTKLRRASFIRYSYLASWASMPDLASSARTLFNSSIFVYGPTRTR